MNYPSGNTHLFMLIADPVAHVRAAQFVNPILEQKGVDAFLIPVHVRAGDLSDVVPRLAKLGNVKGLIVTIPHKEAMVQLCSELGPNASMIRAVNAVRIGADGRLTGEMFDGEGLIAAARIGEIGYQGRRVLILGAGGAGRAVAFALAREGAGEISIHNRTTSRAEKLVADIKAALPRANVRVAAADPHNIDLIVNCTSVGLHAGDGAALDAATIAPKTDVIDIIAVRETELMRAARAKGCNVLGGRPMVEAQLEAQLAFIGMPPLLAR
jgi:shikimate dehydrogenase